MGFAMGLLAVVLAACSTSMDPSAGAAGRHLRAATPTTGIRTRPGPPTSGPQPDSNLRAAVPRR